ncbi:TRAP transporter substrate-binding protein [Halomonas sp. MCCC 1A17488]|uniref:TRAP transporter substrate-binding protein n=1 Tax=Billgrantia sulfidoxydans TaxID=2733484 RepID=A0ABX7W4C3_9GAMM|nr:MULTISPECIES: TRAP transporter substrate-binding protein [Halomonas]MCE8015560.1 TRAP transporter substrate-binding protein [Halomonas sp. MCCC 1A17488]MCG3238893.1 TRAP transporter substrate-binding protein [Halomonas sp. MCCC 1A17488]QPP51147.1 TRAP transporter substrate-binding protein [Halomonas sp. SS10-MC5]QTP54716.1 TRAP transporter substrate-binding protein [Halomonas sulfidoxydans]
MTPIWRNTLTLAGAATLSVGLAYAQSPDLSDPPAIEGEVVGDHGSHTLRMGIGLAESSPQYLSSQYFADILEQRTDGRITVNIFPNSQLGDDVQMMEMLQTGSLDMTYPSSSPATTYVEELAVFDLPFLLPNREAAIAVMQSDTAQRMLDGFEGSGIKALAFSENGYRQLSNSVRPVESPEDVAGLDVSGLTIRTMENPVHLSIWETLGANPTPMAFGELFSAMEQGVVDGQENPWSTILTSNFHEVQDYGSETRHVYTPFIMMISERTWERMAPEYQELVQEAARQSAEYEIQLATEYDDWSREQLEEKGMQITRLDDEQIAAFQEAVQPVYDEWAPRIGEDLIAEIQEIVESSSQ